MYHYYVRYTGYPKDKNISDLRVINGDAEILMDNPITSMDDIVNLKKRLVEKNGFKDVDIFFDFYMLLRKDA